MRRLLIISLTSLILLLLLAISWFSWKIFFTPLTITGQSQIITVPPDITVTALANNLHQQGILPQPQLFILFTQLQGTLKQIKVGEYRLHAGMTPSELFQKLLKGQVLMHKVTLVEGWTFQQMLSALRANTQLTHTLQNMDANAIMTKLGHAGEPPEGMFYPDTYLFSTGTKDIRILQMAYDLMQKKLNQAWQNRAPDTPYQSPYQALIVASMIEKEARLNKERPQIAGVILRRLKQQMLLQIDATVIYGVGDNYRGFLTRTNLKTDTPYNTYTRKGLPPTPIAMPREASIQAALHPASGKAVFYVAKGDGSHIFTETLQAHYAAVKKYWLPVEEKMKYRRMHATNDLLSRLSISAKLMLHYWAFVASAFNQQGTH